MMKTAVWNSRIARVAVPLGLVALLYVAWSRWGAMGLAAVGGGIVMWLLLHFNRLMAVMRRAANTPIGWVDSAVMLNARLKPGATLLHVMALTRSIGQPLDAHGQEIPVQSAQLNEQPQQSYRWRDNSNSAVTCYFEDGKLIRWELFRPEIPPETTIR